MCGRFGFGLGYVTFQLDWLETKDQSAARAGAATRHECGSQPQRALRRRVRGYVHGLGSAQSRMLARHAGAAVVSHRVNVTNVGTMGASTAVLAFSAPPQPGEGGRPIEQLFGFAKVRLEPGQSQSIFFDMRARDLTLVNATGARVVGHGTWSIRVGVEGDQVLAPVHTRLCV